MQTGFNTMETITKPKTSAKRQGAGISVYVPSTATPTSSEHIRRLDQVVGGLVTKGVSMKMLHAVTTLYLEEQGGMSMGELSQRIGVSSAALTGVADGVERLGLASRSASTNDRRSTRFKLTESGIAFVERISECLENGSTPSSGLPN